MKLAFGPTTPPPANGSAGSEAAASSVAGAQPPAAFDLLLALFAGAAPTPPPAADPALEGEAPRAPSPGEGEAAAARMLPLPNGVSTDAGASPVPGGAAASPALALPSIAMQTGSPLARGATAPEPASAGPPPEPGIPQATLQRDLREMPAPPVPDVREPASQEQMRRLDPRGPRDLPLLERPAEGRPAPPPALPLASERPQSFVSATPAATATAREGLPAAPPAAPVPDPGVSGRQPEAELAPTPPSVGGETEAAGRSGTAQVTGPGFEAPPLRSPAAVAGGGAADPAPAPQPVLPARVTWLAEQGGGSARLELHPRELGEVEVSVRVRGNRVEVQFVADDPAAQLAVAASRERLVDALGSRDLRMEGFEVRSSSDAGVERDAGRSHADGGRPDEDGLGREGRPARDDAPAWRLASPTDASSLPQHAHGARAEGVDLRV